MRARRAPGAMVQLVPDAPPEPPPDRGRLMTPEDVAREKFSGKVKPKWVRRHVRPKLRFGHSTVFFYERDVDDWILAHREKAS